jgi:hypothetical protein
MTHGTAYAYRKGRCRCEKCREAHAAAQRAWKERTRGEPVRTRGPSDPMSEALLSDLLNELFPDGLTDDCPARQAKAAA